MVTLRRFLAPPSCLDALLARYTVRHTRLRFATTSSTDADNPYPFPAYRNPTAHQIFHIAANATEEDIKARYYDLVRIYHPDKAGLAAPPDIAHARFRAITTAYDILRKKGGAGVEGAPGGGWTVREGAGAGYYSTTAAWRAASQAKRAQELYAGGKVDDGWKDRLFLAGVVLTVGVFVFQVTLTRREAMSDVVARTRRATTSVDNITTGDSDTKKDMKRLGA
ncbi:hypothetical protein APHAL10511_000193 [Amanita phalloides]|nr:hypothetical protein APHAL10511_000193 [Amanita phalloides]